MGEDTCTTCRAPVTPVITENGRFRFLDLHPVEAGNVVMVEADGRIRARVLTGSSGGAEFDQPTFRMHQCPPPPAAGPACDVCGLPMMPREFVDRTGQVRHAGCEPEFLDQVRAEEHAARAKRRRRR